MLLKAWLEVLAQEKKWSPKGSRRAPQRQEGVGGGGCKGKEGEAKFANEGEAVCGVGKAEIGIDMRCRGKWEAGKGGQQGIGYFVRR